MTTPNYPFEKITSPVPRNAQYALSHSQDGNQKIYFSGMFCGTKYVIPNKKLIACDLDGTLAKLFEPYDPRRIGAPIPRMVKRVQSWLKQGKKVVILTARLNSKEHTPAQIQYTHKLISAWTKKHIGKALPSTSEKHHLMITIYDDRAIQVIPNTGRIKK